MNLSKNLTLEEACVTNTGLRNIPRDSELYNLKSVSEKIFQPCRDHFGKPLKVNSGFRDREVNKAVGGAVNSQHLSGEALDLDFGNKADNKALFEYIKNNLKFDQLINESDYSWIHCSYSASSHNRKEVLEMKKVNGKSTYIKIK